MKDGYVPQLMRSLLERENLKVSEVADALNMSRPSVSQVVNGGAGLSISLALKLEKRFGISAVTALTAQLYEDIAAEAARMDIKLNRHAKLTEKGGEYFADVVKPPERAEQ